MCGCPRNATRLTSRGKRKKAVLLAVLLAAAGFGIGYFCLSGNSIGSFLDGLSGKSSEPQILQEVSSQESVPTSVVTEPDNGPAEESTAPEIPETANHTEEQTPYAFTAPAYGTPYTVMVYETEDTGLALKTAPALDAGRYLYIPENTPLVIDQIGSGWGHTYYNGIAGWVALRYTRVIEEYQAEAPTGGFIKPTAYVVANTYTEGLELRLSPTEHSSTFGPMMDGAVFIVEAYSGQWAYGRYGDRYGWAYSLYLREYGS